MFLYTLLQTNPQGYKFELLIILSLIAIILAIFTIVTKSPIYSILYLIGLFLAVSLYLIGHKLYFMGISYILVYVGAISILFLFILMLINVRISELLTEGRNSTVLSVLVVIVFSIVFNAKLPNSTNLYQQLYNILYYLGINSIISFFYNINTVTSFISRNSNISLVSSNSWDNSLIEQSHISSIGNIMYTIMFIILILLGMLLLLAIVGCIITTVKPKDNIDQVNTTQMPEYMKITSLQSGIDPNSWIEILRIILSLINKLITENSLDQLTTVDISWIKSIGYIISIMCCLSNDINVIELCSKIMEQVNIILQSISSTETSSPCETSSTSETCSNSNGLIPALEQINSENSVSNEASDSLTKSNYFDNLIRPLLEIISGLVNDTDQGSNNGFFQFDPNEVSQLSAPTNAENGDNRTNLYDYLRDAGLPIISDTVGDFRVYLNDNDSYLNNLRNQTNNASNDEVISNARQRGELLLRDFERLDVQMLRYRAYIDLLQQVVNELNYAMNHPEEYQINIELLYHTVSSIDNSMEVAMEYDLGNREIQGIVNRITELSADIERNLPVYEMLEETIRSRNINVNDLNDYNTIVQVRNELVREVYTLHLRRLQSRQELMNALARWYYLDQTY